MSTRFGSERILAVGTISSATTITRRAASAASALMPRLPQAWALPASSLRCAWMMVTSGLSAGTRTSRVPSSSITRSRALLRSRSVPSSERVGMYGTPIAPAFRASEMEKFEWSSTISRGPAPAAPSVQRR